MYAPQFFNQFSGTIAPGGSLSQVVDTDGYTWLGLAVHGAIGTLTPGTLQFRASNDPATQYPLYDHSGTRIGLPLSQTGGQSFSRLDFLEPFRYCVVESSAAQGNGLVVTLSAKY